MASYPQAFISLVLRFKLLFNINYCTACKNVRKTILSVFTAVFRVCGIIQQKSGASLLRFCIKL
jgi:hypothetical protein